MWCRSRVERGCELSERASRVSSTWAHDGRNKVRSLPRRRIFYFIASIDLSVPSSGISLPPPFSPSVHFLTALRHHSDGLNSCCQVSIAPISQPSLSHLVFPNNPQILLQVHQRKRRTSRRRRRPLQTRQALFVPSVTPHHVILTPHPP